MKRFVFSFLFLVLLVSVLVTNVFGSEVKWELVDYNDYVIDVQVDGSNDLVLLDFPVNQFWMGVWQNNNWATKRIGNYINYNAASSFSIMAYPLGYQDVRQLDVTNIPSGTSVTFSFTVEFQKTRTFSSAALWAYYFDSSGNFISAETLWDSPYYSGSQWAIAGDAKFDIPAGAASCYLRFDFANFSADSNKSNVKVTFNRFAMEMSISSLYRQQQLTGKTNELLEKVEDQLAANGEKIDDIIGYDPTPETPDWQDSVDDYHDAEQSALDKVQVGMNDSKQFFTNGIQFLATFASTFAAISILFNYFTTIPFLNYILTVSLCLGIVAALLGIGLDYSRYESRQSARAARSNKKGGSG